MPTKKPTASVEPPAPRGARRKRDTRVRLLGAAMRLMAIRGLDGVAINEITDAADVGFGSFYNHFPSKEAIYDAVIEEVIGHFARALDRLGEKVSDPAEKVASSTRYTLLQGRSDPLWAKLVVRTGFTANGASHGLGKYLLQDLARGMERGRFKIADLPVAFLAVGSTILGTLAAEAESNTTLLGSTEGMPERLATMLLTLLGLELAEAREIAHRPLPVVELPPSPFSA